MTESTSSPTAVRPMGARCGSGYLVHAVRYVPVECADGSVREVPRTRCGKTILRLTWMPVECRTCLRIGGDRG